MIYRPYFEQANWPVWYIYSTSSYNICDLVFYRSLIYSIGRVDPIPIQGNNAHVIEKLKVGHVTFEEALYCAESRTLVPSLRSQYVELIRGQLFTVNVAFAIIM